MKTIPILLFKKGPYLLASLAEDIESIEETKERKILKIKGGKDNMAIDEVIDFIFLPLERLYALPDYIQKSFKSKCIPPWDKAIWGIIESKGRLFPIINLKLLGEIKNEAH